MLGNIENWWSGAIWVMFAAGPGPEPWRHVVAGFKRHTGDGEGQHGLRVAVYDGPDMVVSLVDLRMNHALSIALGRPMIERLRVLNPVLD
jgi:hypothetical protein